MELNEKILDKITYLTGSSGMVQSMPEVPAKEPFAEGVMEFLADVSKILMADSRCRQYPDVVTFAFWIRRASTDKMKDRFCKYDGKIRFGRGLAFHIAPSNVPVNFAYSMAAGLLTGNSNIVRVPGREFLQIKIITDAVNQALQVHESMEPYAVLVRYGHDKSVNDLLSGIADTRIIWGGDAAIAELRKSPLPPRSTEITFADRYSLAVIDSDVYMESCDKERVAEDFYNDTYLTDQNACTSPRMVIWTGSQRERAKEEFWNRLYRIVKEKYAFQDIQGIHKLSSALLASVKAGGVKIEDRTDNLIFRVSAARADRQLMDLKDNSGYFFEYDCNDIMELKDLCDDKRCQTIGMIGNKSNLLPLIKSGVKGIDRIIGIGHMMDFDLIWDGFDLMSQLTRVINTGNRWF